MRKIPVFAVCCLLVLLAASPILAVVSGQVVDAYGSGVGLVLVKFDSTGKGNIVAGAWTDDNGNFGVDVSHGRYSVYVEDQDGKRLGAFTVMVDGNGMHPNVLKLN